jgi:mRNA interferase RelE/StbE
VASYRLLVTRSAAKELERVTDRERRKIAHRVQSLAADPRPHGVEKLTGQERYRVRQGEYRVLYEIDDASREVTVVKIAHRREVYR